MKMKKFLAVCLSALTVTGMLAGCGWEQGLSTLAYQRGRGLFWSVLSGKTANGAGLGL